LKRWLALPLKEAAKMKSSSSGFVFTRQHGGLAQNAKNKTKSDLERLISKLQLERFRLEK
jgi:DNA mismatch repair protein MutS